MGEKKTYSVIKIDIIGDTSVCVRQGYPAISARRQDNCGRQRGGVERWTTGENKFGEVSVSKRVSA